MPLNQSSNQNPTSDMKHGILVGLSGDPYEMACEIMPEYKWVGSI